MKAWCLAIHNNLQRCCLWVAALFWRTTQAAWTASPTTDALPCPGMRISPMQGTDRPLKILVSAVLLSVCRLEGTQC